MELVALPAFTDNYIWMLRDGHAALVVDPGDAAPVLQALDEGSLELSGILVTHHHGDHTGGIPALLPRLKGPVIGPLNEAIPGRTQAVHEGDRLTMLGVDWQVFDVPGHTAGHVAYFAERLHAQPVGLANDDPAAADTPLLFCGDTLFSAGCGRLFDGTMAQLFSSLERLGGLPGATRVCCTHEYTLANLRFAQAVEPANDAVATHMAACQRLREEGRPTLPSTIAREHEINPFLRCAHAEVAAAARLHGAASDQPLAVFTALRSWKNDYR